MKEEPRKTAGGEEAHQRRQKKPHGLYRRTRKDGRPGAWILDTVIRGKRYIRTFDRSLNLTLAREKADESRRKIVAGEDEAPKKPRPTLREYATKWLEDVAGELEAKTRSRYQQDLQNHVLPALGKLRLDEIDTARVKASSGRSKLRSAPGRTRIPRRGATLRTRSG